MEFVYVILGICAIVIECSKKVDTTSIFKKIALLLIVLGSILSYGGIANHLIPVGALAYIFISNLHVFSACDRRKNKQISSVKPKVN